VLSVKIVGTISSIYADKMLVRYVKRTKDDNNNDINTTLDINDSVSVKHRRK